MDPCHVDGDARSLFQRGSHNLARAALGDDQALLSPYFSRWWYERRYAVGGYDLDAGELPRWKTQAAADWFPEGGEPELGHFWRVVEAGWASYDKADAMFMEDIREATERMDRMLDSQIHADKWLVRKPRPE